MRSVKPIEKRMISDWLYKGWSPIRWNPSLDSRRVLELDNAVFCDLRDSKVHQERFPETPPVRCRVLIYFDKIKINRMLPMAGVVKTGRFLSVLAK